jgi:hypothetical protein
MNSLQKASSLPVAPGLPEGQWALFLDIDGTLLEHAAHPDAVSVSDELRTLLGAIDERLNGAVAFITGRSVEVADRLFHPLKLRVAGLYGLEHRLTPDGPVVAADAPADIAALADAIEADLDDGLVHIERKGPILAIHTRAAAHLLPGLHPAGAEDLLGLLHHSLTDQTTTSETSRPEPRSWSRPERTTTTTSSPNSRPAPPPRAHAIRTSALTEHTAPQKARSPTERAFSRFRARNRPSFQVCRI